jgi:ABC-type sugar transport system permease subunit
MSRATQYISEVKSWRDFQVDRQTVIPYLFLLPFILIFGIFWLYPILWGPYMSLFEYSLSGSSTFIGLENYQNILTPGSVFLTAVANTLIVALIVIPAQVIGALVFAILLDSAYTRFKKTQRNLFIVPVVMSTTVLAIVFSMLFEPEGLINLGTSQFLRMQIPWLTDPLWAKVSVAIVLIWKRMGIGILLFLAGLQGIPDNLYQAAKVDGASKLQQFRHVTLPQLQPITVAVVILTTSFTMKMFATPYVLTQGGPGNASRSIVQHLYQEAFSYISLGSAAAMGSVLTIMLMIVMSVQLKVGSREDV